MLSEINMCVVVGMKSGHDPDLNVVQPDTTAVRHPPRETLTDRR